MSRKKRAQDMRQAKDRRMKKIAIGGAVLLVVVLAFEVLHMHGSKSSAPATAATTTADTGAPATAAPTVTPAGTAAAAVPPASTSTKLPNSDAAPERSKSQLYSFSNFAGKDPFVQQIGASSGSAGTSSGSSTGSSTGSSASTSTTPPSTTVDASVKSLPGRKGSSTQTSSRTLARAGAVTISVNGRSESVRIGAGFPSSNPLFRLVSISHGLVRIGIASGSYSSGAQTVSLVAGRPLALVDTADGIRYKLRLLSGA